MTSTPRIITLTVARLRVMAQKIERGGGRVMDATLLWAWAQELDAYDARETRPDPGKRKTRRRTR